MKAFIIILIALLPALAAGQTSVAPKTVDWEAIRENNFIVFLPKGYFAAEDGNYLTGPFSAEVKRHITLVRRINGVVLRVDLFKGDTKNILKNELETEKLDAISNTKQNDVDIRRFGGPEKYGYRDVQYFLCDKDLFVLTAIRKVKDDPIANSFLRSVRVKNGENLLAPNAPAGTDTTSLVRLVEKDEVMLGDDQAIDSKDADMPPVVFYRPRLYVSDDVRRGLKNFRVKVKALLSSSGKVTNVEVLSSTFKGAEKTAIETAKGLLFIPAEKDGKLISVYQTVVYEIRQATF